MSDTRAVGSRYRDDSATDYWQFQEPIGRQGASRDFWKMRDRVENGDRLVEFGCGGAFLLQALPAAERIGVEANPLPRQAAIDRGLDIRPSLADIADGWADVLWSNHALEHTLHPFEILTEMLRVLRPGGKLVLWLPIDDWRKQRHAAEPDVNGHLWTWTPLLMQNLLAEAGFVDATASVVPFSWPRGSQVLLRWPNAYAQAGKAAGIIRGVRELNVIASRP